MICKICNAEMPLVMNYENGFAKLWYCAKCNFDFREIQECSHNFVTHKYVYYSNMINVMTKCTKCDKLFKAHKHREVDLDSLPVKDLTDTTFEYREKCDAVSLAFAKLLKELRIQYKKETNQWTIQQWYYGYLESNMWKRKRDWIFKRSNYKCERCGDKALYVHHKTYERVGYELPEDLMAVCKSCHGMEHSENKDLNIVEQFKLGNL